jgi:hypothetical protein
MALVWREEGEAHLVDGMKPQSGFMGEQKSHRSWGCWGQHEGSPDWRVSGRQCPEP